MTRSEVRFGALNFAKKKGKRLLKLEEMICSAPDCIIRRKPAGYSGSNLPPIPIESCRSFRRKVATKNLL